jgi:hypothetical protein
LFITVPDSLAEELPYFLPQFASDMIQRGLKPRDEDSWEWRSFSKRTSEKHAGIKLRGSKMVILFWGYIFDNKTKLEGLAKILPYKIEILKIPAGEFPARRIKSVK